MCFYLCCLEIFVGHDSSATVIRYLVMVCCVLSLGFPYCQKINLSGVGNIFGLPSLNA